MAWTSAVEPDPDTASRLKYRVADEETANANIRKVAEFVKRERQSFNMGSWHSHCADADGNYPCGTTHCMAGAAVLVCENGREIERLFGTEQAGLLLLGREAASYFHQTESDRPALDFLASKLGEPIE